MLSFNCFLSHIRCKFTKNFSNGVLFYPKYFALFPLVPCRCGGPRELHALFLKNINYRVVFFAPKIV